MVLVSRAEKRAIFTYLLKEGVIVVRKDSYLPRHQDLDGVPNLKVMMIVKSLVSQGFLVGVFNWQWNYYTVTNKGVNFLVKALGVAPNVVPSTYKQKKTMVQAPAKATDGEEGEKATPTPDAAAAEGETPGMGRGAR